MGDFQIIHMPYNCQLLPFHHFVRHTMVVWVDGETFADKEACNVFVVKFRRLQGPVKCLCQSGDDVWLVATVVVGGN